MHRVRVVICHHHDSRLGDKFAVKLKERFVTRDPVFALFGTFAGLVGAYSFKPQSGDASE